MPTIAKNDEGETPMRFYQTPRFWVVLGVVAVVVPFAYLRYREQLRALLLRSLRLGAKPRARER